ncbi:hypothetical protein LFM09_32130 [Lentzea alba]|uniref:hypothetical protein n=1 Tax=Lentzea alba TaxID=2714351 RepID=UPI0039BF653D
MESERLRRYAVVSGTVVSHPPYGIFLTTDTGDRAFIDSDYVADGGVRRDEWPQPGERVRGMVLGVTRDGRVRLSTRQSDVDLVDEGVDASRAMAAWDAFRQAGDAGSGQELLALPDAVAVLRWALRQPPGWNLKPKVLGLLEHAPPAVREELAPLL